MSRHIIDNRGQRLSHRIRDFLQDGASAARFAVGYLFFDGLVALSNEIERLDSVSILIGNVVNRLTEEQIREQAVFPVRGGEGLVSDQGDIAATLRDMHDISTAETALNLRRTIDNLRRDTETRALLLLLARCIADGRLKVRLYSQGRIHAKLALIDYPDPHPSWPGIAIVGSSNLTLGADAHPTEMNVVVRDGEDFRTLECWFGSLWANAQNFHRELFDEIVQSWAMSAIPETDSDAANQPVDRSAPRGMPSKRNREYKRE